MAEPSKVFFAEGEDPEMQEAFVNARKTFRYFWREMAWERRRIIPALDLACVKAPFSDGKKKKNKTTKGQPEVEVEHMWLDEIDFDGRVVSGVLINNPNWLKSVKVGQSVSVPVEEISDWMYDLGGQVYGAFTVNLLRARMKKRERAEHDEAWGRNFGDPKKTRLVLKGAEGEHPLSEAMAPSLKKQLKEDPTLVHNKDDAGWTFLHHEALAGSAPTVKVLLDCGADPEVVTGHGMTALQLAQSLGWDRVVGLLKE